MAITDQLLDVHERRVLIELLCIAMGETMNLKEKHKEDAVLLERLDERHKALASIRTKLFG